MAGGTPRIAPLVRTIHQLGPGAIGRQVRELGGGEAGIGVQRARVQPPDRAWLQTWKAWDVDEKPKKRCEIANWHSKLVREVWLEIKKLRHWQIESIYLKSRDGWMASLTQWTWVWANFGRQWRTGKPGMLQPMGSQRAGHDLVNSNKSHEIRWKHLDWELSLGPL